MSNRAAMRGLFKPVVPVVYVATGCNWLVYIIFNHRKSCDDVSSFNAGHDWDPKAKRFCGCRAEAEKFKYLMATRGRDKAS